MFTPVKEQVHFEEVPQLPLNYPNTLFTAISLQPSKEAYFLNLPLNKRSMRSFKLSELCRLKRNLPYVFTPQSNHLEKLLSKGKPPNNTYLNFSCRNMDNECYKQNSKVSSKICMQQKYSGLHFQFYTYS